MRRIVTALALGAVFAFSASFTPPAVDDDCTVTDELTVHGLIGTDELGQKVLRGQIHNASTYLEYSNVIVKADLCDDQGNVLSTQTITIDEDIEKDEEEEFVVPLDPAANVTTADYTIICAERDFAGLSY